MEISIALSSRHLGGAKLCESWSCVCAGIRRQFFPPNKVVIRKFALSLSTVRLKWSMLDRFQTLNFLSAAFNSNELNSLLYNCILLHTKNNILINLRFVMHAEENKTVEKAI